MSDIVERLRNIADDVPTKHEARTIAEAADTIERLRSACETMMARATASWDGDEHTVYMDEEVWEAFVAVINVPPDRTQNRTQSEKPE